MTSFQKKVYTLTKRIPRGKVATYAVLARAMRNPRAVRAVGNALNRNPFREVPCHRVVRSDSSVGGFARGAAEKMKLLRREGVLIQEGKVGERHILTSLHTR